MIADIHIHGAFNLIATALDALHFGNFVAESEWGRDSKGLCGQMS